MLAGPRDNPRWVADELGARVIRLNKNPSCEAVRREAEQEPDALGELNNAILAPVTLPTGGTK